jgi:hypothetical protein
VGKEQGRQMRERIAQTAARLMETDGISDFALAKRKAARQLGAPSTRNLPDNSEVEAALLDYQQLFAPESQNARIRHLREQARQLMRLLAPFNPFLSGQVVSGSAVRYSAVDIQLFAESSKQVEIFLIDRKIPYRSSGTRMYIGKEYRDISALQLDGNDAEFNVLVFELDDLRRPIRYSPEGHVLDRVDLAWLDSALQSDQDSLIHCAASSAK